MDVFDKISQETKKDIFDDISQESIDVFDKISQEPIESPDRTLGVAGAIPPEFFMSDETPSPKKPTPKELQIKYGEYYKETPEWRYWHEGVERPLIDPIDLASGATFGTVMARKMGKTGAKVTKAAFKEGVSEMSWGATDIAGTVAKQGIKAISKPKSMARLGVKSNDPDVINVFKQFEKDADIINQSKKLSVEELRDKFSVYFLDDTHNVRKALSKEGAHEAVMRRVFVRHASANAERIMNDVEKQIFRGMTKEDMKTLDFVRQNLRAVEIDKWKGLGVNIHSGGLAGDKRLKALLALQEDNPEKFNYLIKKAREIQDVYVDQLRQGFEAGLYTEQQYKNLLEKGQAYTPKQYIHHIDPHRMVYEGNRKVSVSDSGIKALEEGSEKAITQDSRELLQQVVARTQSRIFKNRANKSLYDFAIENPNNGIVNIIEGAGDKKLSLEKFGQIPTKIPDDQDIINVMIKGEKATMTMPKEIAAEWKGIEPALQESLGNVLNWVSGTKILKAMATGLNPGFAVTNMARDIAYQYFRTDQYSNFLPKYLTQIGNDYRQTFKDALHKKGAYIEYVRDGGGASPLSKQSRLSSGHFKKVQDAMAATGDFSERWTKIAVRNRAIKNGATPEQATFIALDSLDFNQGGLWSKAGDKVFPYLNAGIQGTKGMATAAMQQKGDFAWKVAQVGAVASSIYAYNKLRNPEALEQISNDIKNHYFVITTPFSFLDKNGDERYYYFAIAKDHGQRMFSSFFEQITEAGIDYNQKGETDVDLSRTATALRDQLAILPAGKNMISNGPPLVKAIIGYYFNKDVWRNQDIYKGEEGLPEDEVTSYTPEVYKPLGKIGVSPVRTKYVVDQYSTQSNMFADALGMGLDEALKAMSKEDRALATEEILWKIPLLRRVLKVTDPTIPYREKHKKIKQQLTSENVKQKRKLDEISKEVIDGKKSLDSLKKWINTQPIEDREKLYQRHVARARKPKGLKNSKWWMDVQYEKNPEIKARLYYERWKNLSPTDQKKMDRIADQLSGFGDKFHYYLNGLK